MNKDELDQDDDINFKNDILNYKGYFVENEEENKKPKYYEFGAHFSYKELYECLEILRRKQIKKEMENEEEKENKLIKINQRYNKKIDNRARNNTRNKDIQNNKLQDIINGFNPKIRSRNIGIKTMYENENPNELTFFPINHNINNLSVKKEDKNPYKSISINKTNYIQIYSKNKNLKYDNANQNIINRKINYNHVNENFINNNINKRFNKKNLTNNNQLNKLSDKNIISRNRGQNSIYQQIDNCHPNNQTSNPNINNIKEINSFQSYHMQMKNQSPQSNIYKKNLFLNDSSFNCNSKENINNNKNNFQTRISQINRPKFSFNSLNKNITIKNDKKNNLDKISNNSTSYINTKTKINETMAPFNLDNLLNSYNYNNSKSIKFSSEKKLEKQDPINFRYYYPSFNKYNNFNKNKDYQNISLKKFKNNELSNNIEYKRITAISKPKNNNKSHLYNNNLITEKINQNNNNYFDNQQNINIKLNNNEKREEDSFNYNNIKIDNNMNNLLNLIDKNEKNSRNKNNNYFINNNISSINYNSNNKMINYNNNSNNNIFKKMNLTQQNNNFIQQKNQKIQLRNKIFNYNKNLIYDNYKKKSIGIPSITGKKIFSTSNDDNIIFNNNNNNKKDINKKIRINKNNYYYLNNPIVNKTKNIVNLTRNIIYKPKDKNNTLKKLEISQINNDDNSLNITKNINHLNNKVSNKSYILKNNNTTNLIKKKTPKKKINININIRNNNKIIYNKIIENKVLLK